MAEAASGNFIRMTHGVNRPCLVILALLMRRPTMMSTKASTSRADMNSAPTEAALRPNTLV